MDINPEFISLATKTWSPIHNHLGPQTQERQGFSLRVPVGRPIARRLLDRRESDHGKFEEVEYAEGKKDISSGNHAFE